MPKGAVVNEYQQTFISTTTPPASTDASWQFNFMSNPKKKESNFYRVTCVSAGYFESGAVTHGLYLLAGNFSNGDVWIQGPLNGSSAVTNSQMGALTTVALIAIYDTGASVAAAVNPTGLSFKLNTLTPARPFTLSLFSLNSQVSSDITIAQREARVTAVFKIEEIEA